MSPETTPAPKAWSIHPTRALQAEPFPEAPIGAIGAQAHQAPDARLRPGLYEADEFKLQCRERMGSGLSGFSRRSG